MKVSNHFRHLFFGLTLVSGLSIKANPAPLETQVEIRALNGLSLKIPEDGSNCDPRVIKRNLDKLNNSNILAVTNLTKTIPAYGHCYGSCPSDLDDALVKHCQKAEKLAEIVELL